MQHEEWNKKGNSTRSPAAKTMNDFDSHQDIHDPHFHKLKPLHELEPCFDWHLIERDAMRHLIESKQKIDAKNALISQEIAVKGERRREALKRLTELSAQAHELDHSYTMEHTDHRIAYLWQQVSVSQRHLQKWWQKDIASLHDSVCQLQRKYVAKVKEINDREQQFRDAMEALRERYGLDARTVQIQREINEQIEHFKNESLRVELEHDRIRDRFRRKSRKRRQLDFEFHSLRVECEALKKTLAFAKAKVEHVTSEIPTKSMQGRMKDQIENHLQKLRKRALLQQSGMKYGSSTMPTYLFRRQFMDETHDEYTQQKGYHCERLKEMLPFREKLPAEPDDDYLREKCHHIKRYYIFRQQRVDEGIEDYKHHRRLYYKRLLKLPFRRRGESEDPVEYENEKKSYTTHVLHYFRPQYIDETDSEYFVSRDCHYRHMNWLDFRDRYDDEDPQDYLNNRIEFYRIFLKFRDPNPTETYATYAQAQEEYFASFESYRQRFMSDITDQELHGKSEDQQSTKNNSLVYLDDTTILSHYIHNAISLAGVQGAAINNGGASSGSLPQIDQRMKNRNSSKSLKTIGELRKVVRPFVREKLDRELSFIKFKYADYDMETRLSLSDDQLASGQDSKNSSSMLNGLSLNQSTHNVSAHFSRYVNKKTHWNPRGKLRRYMRVLLQVIQKRAITNGSNNTLWMTTEQRVLEAFKTLDIDGDGWLTHKEFKKMFRLLGHNLTTKAIKKMLKEADENGDGKISFKEFVDLLLEGKQEDTKRPFR